MATSTLGSGTLVLAGTTSGTTTVTATAVAGTTTLTLPAATDTLVGKATTDTLTNKTLTAPTLASANITTALTLTGASGTNGQALTSGGSGNAPTWTTISATPGGSTTQVQYNNAGAFSGITGATTNGTALTLTGAILNGTIGATTPSTGAFTTISSTGTITAGSTNGTVRAGFGILTLESTDNNDVVINCGSTRQTIFKAGGTEKARLTSSAAFVLAGGNTAAGGTGISFPATQSASSDANTLDDYEEGTWTPSLGGNATYDIRTGTYTKIGNVVTITGSIRPSSLGTGSTNTLTGLPFTAAGDAFGGIGYGNGWAVSVYSVHLLISGTTLEVNGFTAASTSTALVNLFQTNARIYFSATYLTS